MRVRGTSGAFALCIIVLAGGCSAILDPGAHASGDAGPGDAGRRDAGPGGTDAGRRDSGPAGTDAGPAGEDAGPLDVDAGGVDAGICAIPPRGSLCCFMDDQCPESAMGMPTYCRGVSSCGLGGEGFCFPDPPPGACFTDDDCPAGRTCRGGPSCGCGTCPMSPPPLPGTCG